LKMGDQKLMQLRRREATKTWFHSSISMTLVWGMTHTALIPVKHSTFSRRSIFYLFLKK